jgi:hypothetical protein
MNGAPALASGTAGTSLGNGPNGTAGLQTSF